MTDRPAPADRSTEDAREPWFEPDGTPVEVGEHSHYGLWDHEGRKYDPLPAPELRADDAVSDVLGTLYEPLRDSADTFLHWLGDRGYVVSPSAGRDGLDVERLAIALTVWWHGGQVASLIAEKWADAAAEIVAREYAALSEQ